MTNGQIAFEAYNKERGGVNFQGNKTPDWFDLPIEIRTAWEVASGAVIASTRKAISFKNCARCGHDHENLGFTKFREPIVEDNSPLVWEWWATCPVTGDPIIMRLFDKKDEPERSA